MTTAPAERRLQAPSPPDAATEGWRIRWGQVLSVAALESLRLRKGPHAVVRVVILLLPLVVAGATVAGLWLRADEMFVEAIVAGGSRRTPDMELASLAKLVRFFVVPFVLYLVAMELFGNAFRAEIAERTLHHLFLMPLRRSSCVLGKYLAGACNLAVATIAVTILAATVLLLAHGRSGLARLVSLDGLSHLASYAALLTLGVLAYGALFLLFGLLVRTPLHLGATLWLWERLTIVLPQSFKRFTVSHYLEALMPVTLAPEWNLAIAGSGEPAWLAATVLLLVAAAAVGLSVVAARRLELTYGAVE